MSSSQQPSPEVERIAASGREILRQRLRTAYQEAAEAHSDLVHFEPAQLDAMADRAAEHADGLQWRRALAQAAAGEFDIPLAEAIDRPEVAAAQEHVGAPSYEQSLTELIESPVPRTPIAASAAETTPDAVVAEPTDPEPIATKSEPTESEPTGQEDDEPEATESADTTEQAQATEAGQSTVATPATVAEPAAESEDSLAVEPDAVEHPTDLDDSEPADDEADVAEEAATEAPTSAEETTPAAESTAVAEPDATQEFKFNPETDWDTPDPAQTQLHLDTADFSAPGSAETVAERTADAEPTLAEESAETDETPSAPVTKPTLAAVPEPEAEPVHESEPAVEREREPEPDAAPEPEPAVEPEPESAPAAVAAAEPEVTQDTEPEQGAESTVESEPQTPAQPSAPVTAAAATGAVGAGAAATVAATAVPKAATADQPRGPRDELTLTALHLGGVTNLPTDDEALELRLSSSGLDIMPVDGEIIGRLPWSEIEDIEVTGARGGFLRRRRDESQLVILTAGGEAFFAVPGFSAEHLQAELEPLLAKYCHRL